MIGQLAVCVNRLNRLSYCIDGAGISARQPFQIISRSGKIFIVVDKERFGDYTGSIGVSQQIATSFFAGFSFDAPVS